VRAKLQTAHELGERLLTLAQQVQDTAMFPVAYRALGTTLFWLGAPAAALPHLAQGIALYDPKNIAPLRYGMGRTLVWCVAALPLGRCGCWGILTRGWHGMMKR
jgi:hypothetical protein